MSAREKRKEHAITELSASIYKYLTETREEAVSLEKQQGKKH